MLKAVISKFFTRNTEVSITDNFLVRGGSGGSLQGSNVALNDTGTLSVNNANFILPARYTMLDNGLRNMFINTRAGLGRVLIGNSEEYANFKFAADGTIVIDQSSGNITSIGGNDGTFNIFNNAGVPTLENKLGASKNIMYDIMFFTP